MTTFVYSRPRVALGIAGIPFSFIRAMASAAIAIARQGVQELREDFVPAVRYVLTGKTHATAIVDRAAEVVDGVASKVGAARSAAFSFFERYVLYRLIAVVFFIASPFAALFVAFDILKEEDFFSGVVAAYRELWDVLKTNRPLVG